MLFAAINNPLPPVRKGTPFHIYIYIELRLNFSVLLLLLETRTLQQANLHASSHPWPRGDSFARVARTPSDAFRSLACPASRGLRAFRACRCPAMTPMGAASVGSSQAGRSARSTARKHRQMSLWDLSEGCKIQRESAKQYVFYFFWCCGKGTSWRPE